MKELLKLLSIALAISTSATYAVISSGHKDAKSEAANSTEGNVADADVKAKHADDKTSHEAADADAKSEKKTEHKADDADAKADADMKDTDTDAKAAKKRKHSDADTDAKATKKAKHKDAAAHADAAKTEHKAADADGKAEHKDTPTHADAHTAHHNVDRKAAKDITARLNAVHTPYTTPFTTLPDAPCCAEKKSTPIAAA